MPQERGVLVQRIAKGSPAAKIGLKPGDRKARIGSEEFLVGGDVILEGHGISSTRDDMLLWHVALTGDTVLSAAEKEKMFRRQVKEGPAADTYYGYGWSIGESAWGGRLIEHNGGNGSFFADFLRYTDDEIVVILSTNDSEVRGGRISHALGRMAHGDDVPAPKPPVAAGAAKPLGASARDAVIRTFRNAHATPRPWVDDAEREKRLTQMRDDLGRLDPDGIVDSADAEVTVRAKGSNGPVGTFKFMFAPDGKLDGIGVEVGN